MGGVVCMINMELKKETMLKKIFLFSLLSFFIGLSQGCNSGENNALSKKGLGLLSSLSQQEAIKFKNEQQVAVIVGIDEYDKPSGLKPLHFAIADAKALKDAFEKQGYTVKLLLNNDAKKGYILDAIAAAGDLLKNPTDKPQGTLIFVFTGHGFSDKNNQNYLAVNGTTINRLSRSGLSLAEVKTEILNSGARRSMLFIDACRDKPARSTKSINNPSFSELKDSEGLNILLSTSKNNVSYEDPRLQHGVFSYFLLKGLKGEAASKNGLLLFDHLANYVTQEVKNYTFGNFPKLQKPYRLGESSGQFLVGALPKTTEKESSLPEKTNPEKTASAIIKPVETSVTNNTSHDKQQLELAFKHQMKRRLPEQA